MAEQVPASLPVEFVERVVYTMVDLGTIRPQLGVAVEFESHLDHARLARAVRLLADAEPVLGCRFVSAAVPPRWDRVEDLDELPLCVVRESSDFATDSAAFVAEPLDPAVGPQLAACVLKGSARDAVVLVLSHLAVDGTALKQGAYLLGEIYRRLERDPDWRPAPNDGARSTEPIIHATKIVDRFKALRPEELFPPTEWGVRGTRREGTPMYVWHNVEPTTLRKLVQYARTHEATVDDLVLTAYYRSLYAALKPAAMGKTPVQLSCDLRGLLPKGTRTALANLSASWFIDAPVESGEPFVETLRCVAEQTAAWKSSGASAQKAIGIGLADRLNRKKGLDALQKQVEASASKLGHGTGYPVFTNIGTIDEERLDFGAGLHATSAYLFGPIAFPSGFVLTASTFRDCLRLSAGIDRKATDIKLARGIVEGTASELEQAVV